eukprot:TRINITY_DN5103_c0_g2_i1.p1 TRINITY_DN5103_c0_g2~~TRINITY_DN5103_c0_g2_i1.p1  ORF type:complete len:334 (+),score=121.84 TRINITY_DN5103_c0_g2_i1:47-1003(+)
MCIRDSMGEALEVYQMAVQILGTIYGQVHKDIGLCFSKIASIHFRIGTKESREQALYYQKQAAYVYEAFHGLDHVQTASAYFNLGLYHYNLRNVGSAVHNLFKSFFLFNILGGEYNPEGLSILVNLALIFQENEQYQTAIGCLYEALDRTIALHGPDHPKTVNLYQGLGTAHFELEDFKKAIEFQEKSVKILTRFCAPNDIRLQEAQAILLRFQKVVQEKQKAEQVKGESKRKFGQNKVRRQPGQESGEHIFKNDAGESSSILKNKEREFLLQKARMARMNARYGFRRRPGFDLMRFLQAQTQEWGQQMEEDESKEGR